MARQLYAFARAVDPTTTREEPTPGDEKQRPGYVMSTAVLKATSGGGCGHRFPGLDAPRWPDT
eukprot:11186666-Lingulodinium_polyedra.AAC.1